MKITKVAEFEVKDCFLAHGRLFFYGFTLNVNEGVVLCADSEQKGIE